MTDKHMLHHRKEWYWPDIIYKTIERFNTHSVYHVDGYSLLCFQLCSSHYTVLQTKSNMRSASIINLVTTETMDNSFGSQLALKASGITMNQ